MWLVKHCVFTGYQCPLTYRLSGGDEPKTVLFAFKGNGAIKKPAFFKNVK